MCEIWSRFSTAVAFESIWFRNKATDLISNVNKFAGARMISQ